MAIHFNTIPIKAHGYPKPRLPIQPILSFSILKLLPLHNPSPPTVFAKPKMFFVNARTSIAYAFQFSGVNSESSVLIPAYHCGSMVEPAIWLNADILLYHMNSDLSPNQQHMEKLIRDADKPVSAMLLPHYFGFPQDIDVWRRFCDKHNLKLIEDCAHAFFGKTSQGQILGNSGDFAVASVRKFFSSPDGGILIGKNLDAVLPTNKPSVKREVQATLQMLLQAAEFGQLGLLGKFLIWLSKCRSDLKKSLPNQSINTTLASNTPNTPQLNWFDPNLITKSGLRISKILMKYCRLSDIVETRRNNYFRFIKGISNIEKLLPLFPALPDDVAPYMVPLLLKSGENDFEQLKRAGIPIWRWEELADSDCELSQQYRLQLLHFPCHQELDPVDIDWICSKLNETLLKN
jgi:perosamine synthetase